ncbi:MAG: hypothetical protein ABUK11_07340, partial [Mariprofundaceae bacterium]
LAVFHTIFNVAGVIIMVPMINPLISLVTNMFKSSPDEYAQPKYLNEASLEFSDTALEALRMETARIYEKAIGVIAKGLSLDKQDILSDTKLKRVIKEHDKAIEYDIDDVYEHEIKSLCSAILDYTNRLSSEPGIARQVSRIRMANQSVLIALKDVKHLQKNMLQYINSDNPHISSEYNRLRQRIAKVMRRLEKIRSREEPSETSILSLDALKLTLEKNMSSLHERLDEVIRDGHISADMAISLMNDSNYTYSIIHNLIQINHNHLKSAEGIETEAEHMIALNREEIDTVLASNDSEERKPEGLR